MQIGNCVGKRHHFTRLLGGKVQRVIVTINLGGGDILHFDKAVKPTTTAPPSRLRLERSLEKTNQEPAATALLPNCP